MNKKIIILVLSIASNLFLLVVVSHSLGENSALKELNNLYLNAACKNIPELRATLEGGVQQLERLTAAERQEWVVLQLSKCGGSDLWHRV